VLFGKPNISDISPQSSKNTISQGKNQGNRIRHKRSLAAYWPNG
jgi:hypothetical protein